MNFNPLGFLLAGSIPNVPYVIVRRDNGEVIRYGECQSSNWNVQAVHPIEAVVNADPTWVSAWYVRTPTGEPNPPPNGLRYNFDSKEWEVE
jgi:hypothetical protein